MILCALAGLSASLRSAANLPAAAYVWQKSKRSNIVSYKVLLHKFVLS
jgi:hypothetical protein